MHSPPKPLYEVAVLVFHGADILDFTGPVEMLSHFSYNQNAEDRDCPFNLRVVASSESIRTGGCLSINADLTLDEAIKQVDSFDILIIPGGPPALMKRLYEANGQECDFIRAFNKEAPVKEDKGERIILSVCTGALLLGSTGAFAGLTVTTHHRAFEKLRNVCKEASKGVEDAKPVEVVSKRYVDGGLNDAGIRIVTAGGISCGMDASLYIGSLKTSVKAAEWTSRLSEYEWKRE